MGASIMSTGTDPWPVALIFFSLMGCVFASVFLRRYNWYLVPESAAFIVIGCIIGLINWLVNPDSYIVTFNPQTFLYGFLPIIIYEAGYSMNKREFFNNIGTILALAIAGTVISTLVVGYGLYGFEQAGFFDLGGSPLITLLFGCLISATDPVATLAVFSSLKVDRTLYSIVFGEAVMNDAVAIALYQTFLGFVDNPAFTTVDLLIALGMFIAKFVGSFIIGNLVGMGTSYLLKRVDMQSPTLITGLVVCIGYVTFAFNEGIMLSGIIAIFFLGISLRHYGMYNVTVEAKHATETLLHSMAYLCESLIYVYIGQSAFAMTHSFNANLILFSLLLILVGRAAHVFPLVNLANLGRVNKVNGRFQTMIWYAGLRGAIAFALAILLPDTVAHRDQIITCTFVIVLATTLVIGSSTVPILRALRIKTGDDPSLDPPSARKRSESFKNTAEGKWQTFDRTYLQPLLSNKYAERESINSVADDESSAEAPNPEADEQPEETTPLVSAMPVNPRYTTKRSRQIASSPSDRLYDRDHV